MQVALDVAQERGFEGLQQKAQLRLQPDLRRANVDQAMNANAVKMQRVAAPFTAETVLGGKRVGGFLYLGSGFRKRQGMASDKRDIGHSTQSGSSSY